MHQASADIPPTAEPLARAYIDALAQAEGVKMTSMLNKRTAGLESEDQFLSELEGTPDPHAPYLRADLVASAVLAARAISAEPGLAGRLRRGDGPVVVIQTHVAELVEPVSTIIDQCAMSNTSSKKLIVARDGSDKNHNGARGNTDVASALNHRYPIAGIAPDPKRHLPSSLLRMSQYWLSLPVLDNWAVRLMLEAITSKPYTGPIDNDLVRVADLSDLNLSFHRDLSPEDCLKRLADVVQSKSKFAGEGPGLEQLDGYGEAKTWGMELAADLAEYRVGRITWAEVDHKGLLLSGPPGVGKTSFAKALAKSAAVPLIATSVADWNAASYLHGTLQAIRNCFAEARRQAPAILFIDELDGISNRATLSGDYVEYWSQIVNLLLECLAGVDEREGVVVLAATNHPDRIDPAILRAGRLDHHIVLEKPNLPTLAKIFRHHLGPDLLPGFDLMQPAMAARGGTGADVEAWVRRAKAASRRARRSLSVDDLLDQIRAGRQPMPAEVRRRIAVHEVGHVIVGQHLGVGQLVGVSILDSGGVAEFEDALAGTMTKEMLERQIAVALAGRAAEEVLLGSASIGAGNGPNSDLARATHFARALETQYGFGVLGNLHLTEGMLDSLPRYPGLLEATKARLETAYNAAASILISRREELESLAKELEARGYLSKADVDATLKTRADEPMVAAE